MTSIRESGAANASETAPGAGFSRGSVAVVTLIACIVGFAAASILQSPASTAEAAGERGLNEPVSKSARQNKIDPADLHQLYVEVNKIKQENAFLRGEIQTLTDQDGIVERLIAHVRQLQESDREIMDLVRPANTEVQDPAGSETASPSAAALVRHEVVTPRASRPIGSPPVPGKRPDQDQGVDIVEAKATPTAKED